MTAAAASGAVSGPRQQQQQQQGSAFSAAALSGPFGAEVAAAAALRKQEQQEPWRSTNKVDELLQKAQQHVRPELLPEFQKLQQQQQQQGFVNRGDEFSAQLAAAAALRRQEEDMKQPVPRVEGEGELVCAVAGVVVVGVVVGVLQLCLCMFAYELCATVCVVPHSCCCRSSLLRCAHTTNHSVQAC